MVKNPKIPRAPAPKPTRRGFGSHAARLGEIVLARAEAALAPLDLKPLAYDTMICIHDGHGMSQQDLSRQVGIYAPKMVGVIDGLEKRGLVERKISPADRRRHALSLTPGGLELLRRASAVAVALEKELFGCVPEKDKARFAALVERIDAEEQARRS